MAGSLATCAAIPFVLHQPRKPVGGAAYLTLTPWATSSATAGDHIDSTTTSFEAIRLTDSLKFAQ